MHLHPSLLSVHSVPSTHPATQLSLRSEQCQPPFHGVRSRGHFYTGMMWCKKHFESCGKLPEEARMKHFRSHSGNFFAQKPLDWLERAAYLTKLLVGQGTVWRWTPSCQWPRIVGVPVRSMQCTPAAVGSKTGQRCTENHHCGWSSLDELFLKFKHKDWFNRISNQKLLNRTSSRELHLQCWFSRIPPECCSALRNTLQFVVCNEISFAAAVLSKKFSRKFCSEVLFRGSVVM